MDLHIGSFIFIRIPLFENSFHMFPLTHFADTNGFQESPGPGLLRLVAAVSVCIPCNTRENLILLDFVGREVTFLSDPIFAGRKANDAQVPNSEHSVFKLSIEKGVQPLMPLVRLRT